MVDIIRGASDNPVSTQKLIDYVKSSDISDGILYTGYPIIGTIDNKYSLDAMLVSKEYGVIVFDIVEEVNITNRIEIRDELYNIIFQRFIGNKQLTLKRGELKFKLDVVTIAPAWPTILNTDHLAINNREGFDEYLSLNKQDDFPEVEYKRLLEAVQAISKLKQKPPRKVVKPDSKGAILNFIETSISNLDRQQSKAVIETVNGIQRIIINRHQFC